MICRIIAAAFRVRRYQAASGRRARASSSPAGTRTCSLPGAAVLRANPHCSRLSTPRSRGASSCSSCVSCRQVPPFAPNARKNTCGCRIVRRRRRLRRLRGLETTAGAVVSPSPHLARPGHAIPHRTTPRHGSSLIRSASPRRCRSAVASHRGRGEFRPEQATGRHAPGRSRWADSSRRSRRTNP